MFIGNVSSVVRDSLCYHNPQTLLFMHTYDIFGFVKQARFTK